MKIAPLAYWWFAPALVRAGYVALTFDPRGQGRSDRQTPTGEQAMAALRHAGG